MGYPVYKLIRAVNRQYPNNGFINYVDVREDMYDSDDPKKDGIIDEDLRDLINEAIFEVYKDVAVDEVYSFPTVPGQNQYALPDDCDLRDIQEVTRTFWAAGFPVPPPHREKTTFVITFWAGEGGTGDMDPVEVEQGDAFTFPECTFTPPAGKVFSYWEVDGEQDDMHYYPGDEIEVQSNITAYAIWRSTEEVIITIKNATQVPDRPLILEWKIINDRNTYSTILNSPNDTHDFVIPKGDTLGQHYSYIHIYSATSTVSRYIELDVVYNEDVTIPIIDWHTGTSDDNSAEPVVTPDPEEPADNGDGGDGDDPLDDLNVTPIDNGDGGYGDNPIDNPSVDFDIEGQGTEPTDPPADDDDNNNGPAF